MKEIYTTTVPLRWGDMDQIGHVNNTVYFRCFEQARVEWIALFPESADNNPAYVVIVHTECSFLKELKAPGVVEIKGRADAEAGSVPLGGVEEAVRDRLAAASEWYLL